MRVPTHALRDVELRHLSSCRGLQGAPAGTSTTGLTQWAGSWGDRSLSIGWDWAMIGGVAALISPNEIRTNIELVGSDGRPAPRIVAQIYLVHWIETVPWRALVLDELHATDCEFFRKH